jgi:CheY-like chemotaxis protein
VLVVEDDDAVRATVKKTLEVAGYSVIDTGSAETALRVYEAHPHAVDVLVVDIGLPKVDGKVLAARVRERDGRVPIVFVSGYADEEELRSARALGPIVSKPFSPETLVEKVSEAARGVTGPLLDQ